MVVSFRCVSLMMNVMVKFGYVAQLAMFASTLSFVLADGNVAAAQRGASTWVLQKGQDISPPRRGRPALRVEGTELSGSTGCNNFTATLVQRPDQRVAISRLG